MTTYTFGPVDPPRALAWSAHARRVLHGIADPWTSPVDQAVSDACPPYSARLLSALRAAGPNGLSIAEQRQVFGRHVPARDVTSARSHLIRLGLVRISDGRTVAATATDPVALRLED